MVLGKTMAKDNSSLGSKTRLVSVLVGISFGKHVKRSTTAGHA